MYKILIVDDEYHNRLLLEEMLEEYDESLIILTAEFGQEGLEIIKKEKPDVVFLDVILPVVDGKQICNSIKNDPDLKKTSIILISAKNIEEEMQEKDIRCADAYVNKPFSTRKIIKTLEEVLSKKGETK